MSTHNIGFYEEISKIIFQLSSNIKYPPYMFFSKTWIGLCDQNLYCSFEETDRACYGLTNLSSSNRNSYEACIINITLLLIVLLQLLMQKITFQEKRFLVISKYQAFKY